VLIASGERTVVVLDLLALSLGDYMHGIFRRRINRVDGDAQMSRDQ
jgi:hypothetical protein